MITEQLRRDGLRRIPSQVRADPVEPDAARAIISWLDVFEQIAGHWLFGSNDRRASESLSVTDRLSVGGGDLGTSSAPQPRRPAQPAESRLRRPRPGPHRHHERSGRSCRADRHVDSAASERFATLIDTSQVAWTRAANRWSELINPGARTDPKLLGAAGEVLAALAAAAHPRLVGRRLA
jgi:hypothetical protein